MANPRPPATLQKIVEGASHDLRTPLSVIMVNAAVLARSEPLDDARRIKAATRIVANVGRMNRMIADLLDFSLAEMQLPAIYRMVDVDLGELALKVVQEERVAHAGRIITLERRGALRGHWDQDRLHRGLATMLTTVLKFGNTAEPLRLTCASSTDDSAVEVAVEAASNPTFGDHLQRLFEAIRLGGEFEKDAHWIPLTVLLQMIQAHQGTLWITASPSDGIRIFAQVPKSPAVQPGHGQ